MTKWISITDSLPDYAEDVLAWNGISYAVGYVIPEVEGDKWIVSFRSSVTHWMPLPRAPEDTKDD